MTTPARSALHRRAVSSGAALVPLLLFAACNEGPTATKSASPAAPTAAASPSALETLILPVLTFPYSATVNTPGPAFRIKQEGTGTLAKFDITNASNIWEAVEGTTNGKGAAVKGLNGGTGYAGLFSSPNPANPSPALEVSSRANASAIRAAANNAVNTKPALDVSTVGVGSVLLANHKGTAGDLAIFQTGDVNKARIDRNGRGYFNDGTRNNGADVAEAFAVEGAARSYEPGDVLVISTRSDRTLERSDAAYSTHVAGVYATKPGVLLSEQGIDDDLAGMVPLGVIGVIPTKVSAENGPIHRGDLLVTARTPGHDMRADPDRVHVGMVLGKALQEFAGPGTGVIRVLVNVK